MIKESSSNSSFFWSHLPKSSVCPFMCAVSLFLTLLYTVVMLHEETLYNVKCPSWNLFLFSVIFVMNLWFWLYSVVIEATFLGNHTLLVQSGLKMGFMLFMLSEIMFFMSFFWAFFHSSLAPTVSTGCLWPPMGVIPINPFGLPLMNTVILLVSGASLTCAHKELTSYGKKTQQSAILWLAYTMCLGVMFTLVQAFEYKEASFSMGEGIYGSCFYMLTGFHGLHVLMGTIMLMTCFVSLYWSHYGPIHHVGLEAAIWYWHFVDVVWLFLFVWMYWWGS